MAHAHATDAFDGHLDARLSQSLVERLVEPSAAARNATGTEPDAQLADGAGLPRHVAGLVRRPYSDIEAVARALQQRAGSMAA